MLGLGLLAGPNTVSVATRLRVGAKVTATELWLAGAVVTTRDAPLSASVGATASGVRRAGAGRAVSEGVGHGAMIERRARAAPLCNPNSLPPLITRALPGVVELIARLALHDDAERRWGALVAGGIRPHARHRRSADREGRGARENTGRGPAARGDDGGAGDGDVTRRADGVALQDGRERHRGTGGAGVGPGIHRAVAVRDRDVGRARVGAGLAVAAEAVVAGAHKGAVDVGAGGVG
jgi:hypothetical protein